MEIKTTLRQDLKQKPPLDATLPFGRHFTDHMFVMDYNVKDGWHNACITPYAPIALDPAASALHYGQAIFEGMKVFKGDDGKVLAFRPEKNMQRLNKSAERMCMPIVDENFALDALFKLIKIEKDWVPSDLAASLYIRPFMIATCDALGLAPSDTYKFAIILCPVGSYYKGGIAPVRIFVEEEFVRAVRGGTGFAKCAGNYAGTMLSQRRAVANGFDQVLWLDGVHREFIEEVGAMNVMFVIDNKIVTPQTGGSILPGITRESILQLLADWGYKIEERAISIKELEKVYDEGKIQEAFGCGTAAVVTPIGELVYGEKTFKLANGAAGELTQRIYDEVTQLQRGKCEDKHGWVKIVCN